MKKRKKYLIAFLCSLLICSLAVVQFMAGDIAEAITGSITTQYIDFFTGETVKTLTTEDKLPLATYAKEAPDVGSDYIIFGESKKSVTLTEDNPNQNITFYYYKDGEQMGIMQSKYVDISTGEEIATSTSQSNANLVDIKAPSNNTISFNGKNYTYSSYKVDYQISTGEQAKAIVTYQYKSDEVLKVGTVTSIFKDEQGRILAKDVQENVALNTTTVNAGEVKDFVCTSENPVKISLTKDNPTATVEFTYKYTGTETLPDKIGIVLKLKNKLTGEVFETQNQSVEWGKEIQVPSTNKDGYTLCDPDQTILLTLADSKTPAEERPIEVEYTPDIAKVIIHYQDADGNKLLEDDIFDNLKFGTNTYSAKEKIGWTPLEPSIQQVTFDTDSYEKEITFKYTKNVQTKYIVYIKYVDEQGNSIATPTTKLDYSSTIIVNAKTIEGYTLIDESSKEVKMTNKNPSATVIFKYKKNGSTPITPPETSTPEETQGTIVINYFLENSQTSVKNSESVKKDFGTQSFTAPDIEGYSLVGDKVKSATISKESPNSSVTFYYKKLNNESSGTEDKPSETPEDKPNETPDNSNSNKDNFTTGKVIVHFVDSNGNKLLDDDIKTGLSEGTYSYYGKTISGYTLNGSSKVTFALSPNNPSKEITYTYVKNSTSNNGGSLTILFVDDTTGESLLSSQVYSDINSGTYTYKANQINGYTVYGNDTQTITIGDNTQGQITFRYRKNSEGVKENKEESTVNKQGSITIKYIDKSTGKEIAPSKSFDNLEYKSYTYSAEIIEGYEVSGSKEQSATLSSSMKNMVITFEYNKTKESKSVAKVDSSKKTSNTVNANKAEDSFDKESSFDFKGLALKAGIGLVILIIVVLMIVAIKNSKKDENNIDDDFEL